MLIKLPIIFLRQAIIVNCYTSQLNIEGLGEAKLTVSLRVSYYGRYQKKVQLPVTFFSELMSR